MTNSTNTVSEDNSMGSQKLEEVTSFKYQGATLSKMATAQQKSIPGLPQQWQIKQDLAAQHDQVRNNIQLVQVSCQFHPHRWL